VSPEKDPLVGTVVDGRYRVLSRLSEGGMGVVYRAEHVFLKRDVALKRLHRELTGHGQAVARFEREAQAAARIDHPNVCQVLDCGVGDDGTFFIAMELLEGTPLDRRIAEAAPLTLAEISDVGAQICDALQRAHALEIVHRDLKPENVMLVPRREGPGVVAKIMDFGIAKVAQEGDGRKLTQAGMIFGTPQYMAPEQAAGGLVDARADLYALGVILFEMATGRCPFESPTVSGLLTKHLTEPAPPLEAAVPHLAFPPPFRALVARCLDKDPDQRFPSAAELAAALRACSGLSATLVAPPPAPAPLEQVHAPTVLAAGPVVPSTVGPLTAGAPPPTMVLPAHGWSRRSRVSWIVAGVTTGVVLVALVAVLIGQSGSREPAAGSGDAVAGVDAGTAGSPRTTGAAAPAPVPAVSDASSPLAVGPLLPTPRFGEGPTAAELAGAAAEERRAFETGVPEVAAALALARDGKVRDAIAQLQWLAMKLDASAHFHFELAVLFARDRKLAEALDHARRVVELDRRYAADAELLALAYQGLAGRPTAEAAESYFTQVLDERTAEQLVRIALEGNRSAPTLRRVRDLLERRGLLAGIPEFLRQPLRAFAAETCPARKAVLREILAGPDGRMAPYLRRFKGESGCGVMGLMDCWSCERGELRAALKAVDAAAAGGGSATDAAP